MEEDFEVLFELITAGTLATLRSTIFRCSKRGCDSGDLGAQNQFSLNETLLAMKVYVPYRNLYAVTAVFAIFCNHTDKVSSARKSLESAERCNMMAEVVCAAETRLNMALEDVAINPSPRPRTCPQEPSEIRGISGRDKRHS